MPTGDPFRRWSDEQVLGATLLVMGTAFCAALGYDGAAVVLGVVALAVVLAAAAG